MIDFIIPSYTRLVDRQGRLIFISPLCDAGHTHNDAWIPSCSSVTAQLDVTINLNSEKRLSAVPYFNGEV